MPLTVFTIGHSNRSLDAFLAILKAHQIECLADIRTIPRSRHNPQFSAESLEKSLPRAGITYARLPRLGGLRRPRKVSEPAAAAKRAAPVWSTPRTEPCSLPRPPYR